MDPFLFSLSYDFVGDLAETVALIWPAQAESTPPSVTQIVTALSSRPKSELPALLAGWLDASGPAVRYALLKLITGSLRVGASARLAKTALAEFAAARGQSVAPDDVEEVWHGLSPPYAKLWDWLEGRSGPPDSAGAAVFRPPMLAQPLEAGDLANLVAAEHVAEWKWDGIRVQLVRAPGGERVFSRGAEDVSAAFPDLAGVLHADAVLDGELLVVRCGVVAPFADLQQRLNRKAASAKMTRDFPLCVRLYDILFDGAEDVRSLPFEQRRAAAGGLADTASGPAAGPVRADRFRLDGGAGRHPCRHARRLHRRGDAEAPGQPLRAGPAERLVVEVETRPADHRRGSDVCAARSRQTQQLLLGLHVRVVAS